MGRWNATTATIFQVEVHIVWTGAVLTACSGIRHIRALVDCTVLYYILPAEKFLILAFGFIFLSWRRDECSPL